MATYSDVDDSDGRFVYGEFRGDVDQDEFISAITNRIDFEKTKEERSAVAATIVNVSISYPFHYVKTLMQMGHEPLPPYIRSGMFPFGGSGYYLPGIPTYLRYIRQVDGTSGLWRGCCSYIVSKIVLNYTTLRFKKVLLAKEDTKELDRSGSGREAALDLFVQRLRTDIVASSFGIVLSHPFYVVAVRCMAQFVGGESKYSSINIVQSFAAIYDQQGISGFFSGLIPSLLLNGTSVAITSWLSFIIQNHVIKNKNYDQFTKMFSTVIIEQLSSHHSPFPFQLIAGSITYPLAVVTTIASVNNSGIEAGCPPCMPIFDGWFDILVYLARNNQLKRGAGFFARSINMPLL
ncbi:hypothetical protein ACOME3_009554 [Neoechinorhynchus agilis]